MADALKVFPDALKRNSCRAGETESRSADGATACERLKVVDYKLDNDSFMLTLAFNTNGTLRFVSVLKLIDDFSPTETRLPLSTIQSKASSLADMLASKYGPAVANAPGASLNIGGSKILDLEWQPGRSNKWQSGGDRISLKAEARNKDGMGLYEGDIQIFYRFERTGELDAL